MELDINLQTHIFKTSTFNTSKRKAMNRNWSNQKANPALKTKREINKYYIQIDKIQ